MDEGVGRLGSFSTMLTGSLSASGRSEKPGFFHACMSFMRIAGLRWLGGCHDGSRLSGVG